MLTVRLRLLTFRYQVSTICYKIFDAHRFDMLYDFHLQMSRAKFSYTKLFRQQLLTQFIDENAPIITIFVHSFLRKAQVPILALKYNF